MRTLGLLLGLGSLPLAETLDLASDGVGDEGMIALCEGLGWGAAPCLSLVVVNNIGPQGAAALAPVVPARGETGVASAALIFLSVTPRSLSGATASISCGSESRRSEPRSLTPSWSRMASRRPASERSPPPLREPDP